MPETCSAGESSSGRDSDDRMNCDKYTACAACAIHEQELDLRAITEDEKEELEGDAEFAVYAAAASVIGWVKICCYRGPAIKGGCLAWRHTSVVGLIYSTSISVRMFGTRRTY